MSTTATLTQLDERGVARITLARPEVLNAFDEQMILQLADAFAQFGANAAARVIVLAGEGRLFCAGADVAWMQRQSENSHEANVADARRFAAMLQAIQECPKPVIARVHGHAFGGGVGLLAAADVVVAAEGARFAISEARFGILPSVIGPYIAQALGPRQAKRLAMTTEQFNADEALRLGLVHRLVAPADLDATVEAVIVAILESGPIALGEIKRLFAEIGGRPIDDRIRELTAQTIARVRGSDEAKEGFAAFFAKRPPAWSRK